MVSHVRCAAGFDWLAADFESNVQCACVPSAALCTPSLRAFLYRVLLTVCSSLSCVAVCLRSHSAHSSPRPASRLPTSNAWQTGSCFVALARLTSSWLSVWLRCAAQRSSLLPACPALLTLLVVKVPAADLRLAFFSSLSARGLVLILCSLCARVDCAA